MVAVMLFALHFFAFAIYMLNQIFNITEVLHVTNANALIAPEPVNRGRQIELDIAKGLAILFMLLVHSFEEFTAWPLQQNVPTYIIEFLGSPPGAPVFMFAMGVGIAYSRKCHAKDLAKRGICLLLGAYILSFFRDFLPHYVLYLKTGATDYLHEALSLLLAADILQFAGLAFLFFGLAVKLNFKAWHYAGAAAIFAGINILVRGISPDSQALKVILGLFWGTDPYAWFPLFNWSAYPICGFLFGQLLIRCTDKRRFYRLALWASLVVMMLFGTYAFVNNVDFGALDGFYQDPYYHHDLIGNIVLVAFVVFWTSLLYFLSNYMPEFVKRTFSRWSKNITVIYCVHWLIIGWSLTIMPLPLDLPWILLYFAVLLVVSDAIAVGYQKLKARVLLGISNRKNVRQAA